MSHTNSPHISPAAAEILALINSRPRTPTKEEIAAVLEVHKALAAPDAARETYLASDWHRALEEYLVATLTITTDDALDRLEDVTEAICAEPVRTFDNLVVRAAMAAHFYADELSNPERTVDDVLAGVVRGVLDLAGVRLDAEGRLL
jgi:hypothetical protein